MAKPPGERRRTFHLWYDDDENAPYGRRSHVRDDCNKKVRHLLKKSITPDCVAFAKANPGAVWPRRGYYWAAGVYTGAKMNFNIGPNSKVHSYQEFPPSRRTDSFMRSRVLTQTPIAVC
jgi:hypothetical protein